MHQRLAAVTSYLRQAKWAGQLHSCSGLGQSERPDGEPCVDRCGETYFLHSVKCGPMLCLFFHLTRAGHSRLEWVFWSSRLYLSVSWGADYNVRLEKGDNLCLLSLHLRMALLAESPQDKEQYAVAHTLRISHYLYCRNEHYHIIMLCSNNTCMVSYEIFH